MCGRIHMMNTKFNEFDSHMSHVKNAERGSWKELIHAENSILCRGIEGRIGVVEETTVNGNNLVQRKEKGNCLYYQSA
jgi:hypothetical protein